MNKKFFILSGILLFSFMLIQTGCKGKSDTKERGTPQLKEVWQTAQSFKVPESVYYNFEQDILYISNINGAPTEKNGTGFISKVSLKGEIEILEWVTGLNAPKGMGVFGNSLYVTDINQLVEIDITQGTITKTYDVEGADFLNDIAVDPEGTVFISDMTQNKIYILENGEVEVFLEGEPLNGPNGLYMEESVLYVGISDKILAVNTITRDIQSWIETGSGMIDGLKADGKGNYVISDWVGKTRLVGKNIDPALLLDTTEQKINSADIEFIIEDQLLLIPTFFDNRVTAYKLEWK